MIGHWQCAKVGALGDAAWDGFREGQRFRSGLLAGAVFGDRKGLWGIGAHGGGGSTGGTSEGAGGQRRLADGDGGGEYSNLLVGGLLDVPLKLSHLIHGHVWVGKTFNQTGLGKGQVLGFFSHFVSHIFSKYLSNVHLSLLNSTHFSEIVYI